MESGMLDQYVKVRQGLLEPEYYHPKMKDSLAITGGVFIFQEQVMQLARDLAGYSMADADKLRKIMGKKQPEEMAKQEEKFVQGCVVHSGMQEILATDLFHKIEKFAGYGFNLAHSCTYSVISYWCAYLKTHYPSEFFAGLLTIADDETKLQSAVVDALKHNVIVAPPDINVSTDKFEFKNVNGETHIVTPFGKIKGVGEKTVQAILDARYKNGGKFASKAELTNVVVTRNCKIRHIDVLDRVGAFAEIEPGQLPARHQDRLKDQMESLPGLICEFVLSSKTTKLNDISLAASALIRSVEACEKCELKCQPHIKPIAGPKIKFMVITDSPNSSEAQEGRALQGNSCTPLLNAIKEAGLKKNEGYYTTFVKAEKPKDVKTFANETLLECSKFLEEEIRIVQPGVIVAMGGATIRYFAPDIRGGWSELCGKSIYSKQYDCHILFGVNPQIGFFRDEVVGMMVDVFKKVDQIVN
jgi:DNA polymerase-3 subunit alpha